MSSRCRWIVSLLFAILPISSPAALLSVDSEYGLDSLTVDTDTGLVWLDPIRTAGISWNTMQAELTPGGEYQRWRYATPAEIPVLYAHAGIPFPGSGLPANVNSVMALIALLGGPTSQSGSDIEVTGFIGSSADDTTANLALLGVAADGPLGTYGYAFEGPAGGALKNLALPSIGHWLVTDVPEPSTIWLSGLAMLALLAKVHRARDSN
jgi:hypothetical protein